jgi:hypothetical protein
MYRLLIIKTFLLIAYSSLLSQTPIVVNEDLYEGVIFTKNYTNHGGHFRWLNKSIGNKRFTPTVEQVKVLEKRLLNEIEKPFIKGNMTIELPSNLENYIRQYFGYFEKGKAFIAIRFFDKNSLLQVPEFNVQKQSVDSLISWSVLYSVEKNILVDAWINNSYKKGIHF